MCAQLGGQKSAPVAGIFTYIFLFVCRITQKYTHFILDATFRQRNMF